MDVAASLGLGFIPEEEKSLKMAKKGLKCGIPGAFPSLSPDKQEVNHQMSCQEFKAQMKQQERFFQGNLEVLNPRIPHREVQENSGVF